jgi:hypothetical protein
MAGTGRLAAAVRRRLPTPKVTRAPRKADGPSKQAPPKISKRDLTALRAGRVSVTLRGKLFGESAAVTPAKSRADGRSKQAPTQAPPRAKR